MTRKKFKKFMFEDTKCDDFKRYNYSSCMAASCGCDSNILGMVGIDDASWTFSNIWVVRSNVYERCNNNNYIIAVFFYDNILHFSCCKFRKVSFSLLLFTSCFWIELWCNIFQLSSISTCSMVISTISLNGFCSYKKHYLTGLY